jgi:hypothetical protein
MPSFGLKGHYPVDLGEQGVISPDTHVVAGVKFRSSLSYQYAPRSHLLSRKTLYAKTLRITIAPIPGASNTFLVCHEFLQVFYKNRRNMGLYLVILTHFTFVCKGKFCP